MILKSFLPAAVLSVAALASAQLTPFNQFRDSLNSAQSATFVGRVRGGVGSSAAFEEMRQHLLTLYTGVHVAHSLLFGEDVFDCVPIMEQPSVRLQGITEIAKTPEPIALEGAGDPAESDIEPATQSPGDACEEGTIPMRRITLEEMTRFPSLQAFFAKSNGETGPTSDPCTTNCEHKYSLTEQNVTSYGGNSWLNLWEPYVYLGLGEVFSLTQHWYVGGAGTTLPGLQTVEVGWQNYPQLYGNEKPRLFIYYTADGYTHTGCYNLTCAAFVQTNHSVYIGGAFDHYSSYLSTQWEARIQVHLVDGRWWMFYAGTAFGYYPTSLYHGGQLTRHAQSDQYGTESVGNPTWPAEGSGQWSSAGYSKAAYQRDNFYINAASKGIWSSLQRLEPSPHCYSITGPAYSSSSGWGIYFYDGGPGGTHC